ncbi:NADH:flavin oxidoreductase/NADH oxidase [Pseudomonas gingeri]|uniref:NADH:flavin oxidoreductase/NADH oxidase n=1 Tax=Pseudomonas gingeri TaxID=117681 RepID=UPI0015A2F1C2|nr:NADH:flavin oxidoreductase/NADH oxidase [Pseudomonas gingeri]NWA25583.1 NADH:flavin oxidoreductase/NADH oxidase [Pseudomonas gingeri]
MSKLFTPFTLKSVTLRNRIAVPPMCQYSAHDGFINDWHVAHYTSLGRGGAGLVIVEATAVSPEGRITPGCTGLWGDEHITGMAQVAAAIKSGGAVPGIQIGHAGRKASANKPWEGDDHIDRKDPRSWETLSPSATAFGANLPQVPKEMTEDDIKRVRADFVATARRALEAGFEWLELHFAHGYLAQSFFSPYANERTDHYGGDQRGRFLLETLEAVRAVWPEHLPLTARFGVIEFDGNDEQTLLASIELIKAMRGAGLDMLNVSMNFTTPEAKIPWGPAFLAPIAHRVRTETGLPVATAWGVDLPMLCEEVLEAEQVDLVMVGRAHLANPHWTYHAAKELGIDKAAWVLPAPYAHWLQRYEPAGPQ